jgi:hypothetical protein
VLFDVNNQLHKQLLQLRALCFELTREVRQLALRRERFEELTRHEIHGRELSLQRVIKGDSQTQPYLQREAPLRQPSKTTQASGVSGTIS